MRCALSTVCVKAVTLLCCARLLLLSAFACHAAHEPMTGVAHVLVVMGDIFLCCMLLSMQVKMRTETQAGCS